MSELAYNINGERFDVPPTMSEWRVLKLKPKGAPEVVYGRDGLPLFLPGDADLEDLRREARGDGRHRLDPVDDRRRAIPNAQSSYVCIHPLESATDSESKVTTVKASADTTSQLISALLTAQKEQTEMARLYYSQFPVMVQALAEVVRSAGDSGMIARVPVVLPAAPAAKVESEAKSSDEAQDEEADDEADDDEAGGELEAVPEYSWPRVVHSLVDELRPMLPQLGTALAMFLAKVTAQGRPGVGPKDPPPAPASEAPSGPPVPGGDASVMGHLNAILAELSPLEAEFARALLNEMPPADLPSLLARVRAMTVSEAVDYVRATFAQASATARAAAGPTSEPSTTARAPIAPVPATSPQHSTPASAPDAARRSGDVMEHRPETLPAPEAPGTSALGARESEHIAAIQRALTAEEYALMRARFLAMSPEHRAELIRALLTLKVPDAVATIRSQLLGELAIPPVVTAPELAIPPLAMHGSTEPTKVPVAATTVATSERDAAVPNSGETVSAPAQKDAPAEPGVPAAWRNAAPSIVSVVTADYFPSLGEIPSWFDPLGEHLAAIHDALTPEERTMAGAMMSECPRDMREALTGWIADASVEVAVELLRAELQRRTGAPGASGPTTTRTGGTHPDAPPAGVAAELGTPAVTTPVATPATSGALPELDSAAKAKMHDVWKLLTFPERRDARQLLDHLSREEQIRWCGELGKLPLGDAVAEVRAVLAEAYRGSGDSRNGGVS